MCRKVKPGVQELWHGKTPEFHITSPLESPNAGSREEKKRNGGSGTKQIKEADLTYFEKWVEVHSGQTSEICKS